MLKANDYRGVFAIIPTPCVEGGDRFDATNTVNLDETERLVNNLLDAGVSGLIALGTTGECATLSTDDYSAFARCVLETVGKRVPTFMGTSALGAHEVAARTRLVRDAGADGVLLGLPQWQICTHDMAIAFYEQFAEAFPDTNIMVYANTRAFRFEFADEFWAEVSEKVPNVTSAKFSIPPRLANAQKAAKGRIHFMPHEMGLPKFLEISPETTTSCWATAASMGPEPVLAIMNAVLAGDKARMDEVSKDIAWASETVVPLIQNAELFTFYNIQMEKYRINASGYCDGGPVRPPYNMMPADLYEDSLECGRRWAQIRKKYM